MSNTQVTYTISLRDQFSGVLKTADGNVDRFESHLGRAQNRMNGFGSSLNRLYGRMAVLFSIREVVEYGKSIVDTTAKMEGYRNLINFASRDQLEATKNQAEALKIVTQFRTPLMETYQQYAGFLAAIRGTPLEGEKARKTFENMSASLAIMHLPAAQAGRVMYAVKEMFAEGRVQTRHFVRQMAAAMPGAMEEGAKVLRTTIPEFMHRLQSKIGHGGLTSYEFLPKFFQAVRDLYGKNLPVALDSLQSRIQQLKNNFDTLKISLGTTFEGGIKNGIAFLNGAMEGLIRHVPQIKAFGSYMVKEFLPSVKAGFYVFKESVKWILEHKEQIAALIKSYIAFKLAMGTLDLIQRAREWGLVSGAIKVATGEMSLLNTISKNPFAWIITATVAIHALEMSIIAARKAAENASRDSAGQYSEDAHGRMVSSFQKLKSRGWSNEKAEQGAYALETANFYKKYSGLPGHGGKANDEYDFKYQALRRLTNKKGGLLEDIANGAGGVGGKTPAEIAGQDTSIGDIGGTKPTNIYITMKNLIEHFEVKTNSVREGAQEIKHSITETIVGAVNNANLAIGR